MGALWIIYYPTESQAPQAHAARPRLLKAANNGLRRKETDAGATGTEILSVYSLSKKISHLGPDFWGKLGFGDQIELANGRKDIQIERKLES